MTASTSPLAKIDVSRLLSAEAKRSPEMEEVWAFIQAEDAKLPDQSRMTVAEQRQVRAISSKRWNSDLPAVRNAIHMTIPGLFDAPAVSCELIEPLEVAPGCIVYMHGGGWTFGSLESHANLARNLAIAAKTRVLAVDYRLAPEHPFPAALDDVVAALRYEADADAPFLAAARPLLDPVALRQAEALGAALRLAFTLSGGTPVLLAGTALRRFGGELRLRLVEGSGVFAGESVQRRLDALANALGLPATVEVAGA